MITIPTGEFLAMIADMLPFVDSDKDSLATHCVRIEQVDETLFMLATNRSAMARVSWTVDEMNRTVFSERDFSVRISPSDAKAIVSTFKLPTKLDRTPLTVSAIRRMEDNEFHLKIHRAGGPGWSESVMSVTGRGVPDVHNGDSPEPDIHSLISLEGGRDELAGLDVAHWSPRVLIALGKVERHGVLEFQHTSSRDGGAVYVKAGDRFEAVAFRAKVGNEWRPGGAMSHADVNDPAREQVLA